MDVPVKHFLMTRLNLTRSYGPGPVLIAVFRLAILLIMVSAGTFTLLSFSPVDPIRAYIGNDLLHVPPNSTPSLPHAGDWTNRCGYASGIGFRKSSRAISDIQ